MNPPDRLAMAMCPRCQRVEAWAFGNGQGLGGGTCLPQCVKCGVFTERVYYVPETKPARLDASREAEAKTRLGADGERYEVDPRDPWKLLPKPRTAADVPPTEATPLEYK